MIEFVSYSGRFPNLCSGVLTLMIDGEMVRFGHDYSQYRSWETDGNYPAFWSSGGGLTEDYEACCGRWQIDPDKIPERYKHYADGFDEVFNSNVEYGCCGGCI